MCVAEAVRRVACVCLRGRASERVMTDLLLPLSSSASSGRPCQGSQRTVLSQNPLLRLSLASFLSVSKAAHRCTVLLEARTTGVHLRHGQERERQRERERGRERETDREKERDREAERKRERERDREDEREIDRQRKREREIDRQRGREIGSERKREKMIY